MTEELSIVRLMNMCKNEQKFVVGLWLCGLVVLLGLCMPAVGQDDADGVSRAGVVECANLIYGNDQTSVCYADVFLGSITRDSTIEVEPKFIKVRLESSSLFEYPFAVMTGEGGFRLSDEEQGQLQQYLLGGGFLVASPGCSDEAWGESFMGELSAIFPDLALVRLTMNHPIFHTVYEINELYAKKSGSEPYLMGLEISGRVVLIYSPFGLNDSGNAGENCCCCGGNEIRNARLLNVNILAYALTR